MSRFLAVTLLVALAATACGAEPLTEERDALLAALTNAAETETAIFAKAEEISEHQKLYLRLFGGNDPWTTNRKQARAWSERNGVLGGEMAALLTRRETDGVATERARAAFKRACEPFENLRREALKTYNIIAKTGKDPSNVRRALKTIARDLKLVAGNPLSLRARILDYFLIAVKAGQPPELIDAGMRQLATSDEEKALVGGLSKLAADLALEHGPEKLAKINCWFGRVDKAVKLLRIYEGGTTQPFGNEAMERLVSFMELSNDLIPSELMPMRVVLLIQGEMVKAIYTGLRALSYQNAFINLKALELNATCADAKITTDAGWTGLHPRDLFGRLEPDPSITTDKGTYRPGENVEVKYEGHTSWVGKGWIGMIPAGVAHGSESECDRHDVEYYAMNAVTGSMTFKAPATTGAWTLRMLDDDTHISGDGREVFSVPIEVVPDSPGQLSLARGEFLPGEMIDLDYSAPASWGNGAWVGLMPADAPRGASGVAEKFFLTWQRMQKRPEGRASFRAPSPAGAYQFRMLQGEAGDSPEVACVTFAVKTMPFGLSLEKNTYAPGEEILVRFGASPEWGASAWLGVIPPAVPHGDEDETDGGNYRAWTWLNGATSGYFILTAPTEKGSWDMRMYNANSKGWEQASVPFVVK